MAQSRSSIDRSDDGSIDTHISTSGVDTEQEQEHAVDAVSAAISDIDRRISRCVIRLEHGTDRHHIRHAVARLSVDLDGASVHAHADAETVSQATTLAADRLHEQLRRRLDRLADARRHGQSLADFEADVAEEADRAAVPTVERPTDERELVERAVFGPPTSSLDEAAFDLDALGYDFHLFVETMTGDEVLIRRDTDRIVAQFASGEPEDATAVDVDTFEIDAHPAPHLGLGDARELLHLGHARFVFFRDADSERGQIVFYPDGSSSGGKVRLTRNGRSIDITTAWLNGYVTMRE